MAAVRVAASAEIQSPSQKNKLSYVYGNERIVVERKPRIAKSRRVLIKVQPDCKVFAYAPDDASSELVLAAIKKRSRWIARQLSVFQAQQRNFRPRHYVSGESHFYLGKQYMLKVMEDKTTTTHVKLLRGSIEVHVKKKSAEKVQELLANWYREKAKEAFQKRLEALLEQTLWVKNAPHIKVMEMKKQWGSCSPKGQLTLNVHLIKAPRDCIDYVILHELCHIAEHNHSKRFYRLMAQVMPGWEKTKEKLDDLASRLLKM